MRIQWNENCKRGIKPPIKYNHIYVTRDLFNSIKISYAYRGNLCVLHFKRCARTRVLNFEAKARDVSIRSAVLSAETSNHTLIPALLNLLRRRNSRGPRRPCPREAARPSLISARGTLPFLRNLYIRPWVTVHDETVCTLFGIRDTINDTAESAKLRSIGVSWKPPERPPRVPERSVFPIYYHTFPLSRVRSVWDIKFMCN